MVANPRSVGRGLSERNPDYQEICVRSIKYETYCSLQIESRPRVAQVPPPHRPPGEDRREALREKRAVLTPLRSHELQVTIHLDNLGTPRG